MFQNIPFNAIPSQETLRDTIKRLENVFYEEIMKKVKEGKNVIVVAHQNTIRGLITLIENLQEIDLFDIELKNCEIVKYFLNEKYELERADKKTKEVNLEQMEDNPINLAKEGKIEQEINNKKIQEENKQSHIDQENNQLQNQSLAKRSKGVSHETSITREEIKDHLNPKSDKQPSFIMKDRFRNSPADPERHEEAIENVNHRSEEVSSAMKGKNEDILKRRKSL